MADETDWYDDFIKEEQTDEKIVDLTDIVDGEKMPLTQEDIIELRDIVEDDTDVPDMDSIQKEDLTSKENFEQEDDISFKEGLELEMDDTADEIPVEPYVATAPGLEPSVTQEQLEAALERVIEKKFADKVDMLLLEGMEKAIKKEIIEIKARLKKDLDQMENI
ncbi:MAG: hypothetical protein DRH26_07115 [Deltaproteobacteria bacterium]|nr:MAG: hypothetical protein DRH26_07115 [Deltaproteobacteria bacterium]